MKNIFINMSLEEFERLIEKAVDKSVCKTLSNQESAEEDLIKTPEARKILQVSRTTLHNYVKEGKIQAYQLGSRVFYSKSELINAVKSPRIDG